MNRKVKGGRGTRGAAVFGCVELFCIGRGTTAVWIGKSLDASELAIVISDGIFQIQESVSGQLRA